MLFRMAYRKEGLNECIPQHKSKRRSGLPAPVRQDLRPTSDIDGFLRLPKKAEF